MEIYLSKKNKSSLGTTRKEERRSDFFLDVNSSQRRTPQQRKSKTTKTMAQRQEKLKVKLKSSLPWIQTTLISKYWAGSIYATAPPACPFSQANLLVALLPVLLFIPLPATSFNSPFPFCWKRTREQMGPFALKNHVVRYPHSTGPPPCRTLEGN